MEMVDCVAYWPTSSLRLCTINHSHGAEAASRRPRRDRGISRQFLRPDKGTMGHCLPSRAWPEVRLGLLPYWNGVGRQLLGGDIAQPARIAGVIIGGNRARP